MHITYPTTLPMDCVLNATKILREGKIAENAAMLGADIITVQAYLQGVFLGPVPDHHGFGSSLSDAQKNINEQARNKELQTIANSDEMKDFASAVQDAVGETQRGEFGTKFGAAQAPASEKPWLTLLQALLPLILQLLLQGKAISTADQPAE